MAKERRKVHSAEEAKKELQDVVGCMSCGMPMKRTQREMASDIAQVCPRCVDRSGHLKTYDEVLEGLVTGYYMKKEKMGRTEAEVAAREKMAELPAWKDEKG